MCEKKSHSIYHSHAAYNRAEQKDHVVLDILAPLQQDVEELHKAKWSQQETQHLNGAESKRRMSQEAKNKNKRNKTKNNANTNLANVLTFFLFLSWEKLKQ